ncbi:hypothetical protein [Longimicrobium sp.]|uniref:hypothetical protein n=1 Tax=Longimicrobium sp. TaxID=2029185 RepID=UPI002BE6295E|nr:hypothetical protein [Longimicrobium sp.]HSU15599.1 hypothetical protein [Longimicrobium sp.]
MGSSYSNITLHGAGRDRVIQALEARRRQAYVGPAAMGGCVVVFDEEAEDVPDSGVELAAELSRELGAVALLATVNDDNVFRYTLFRGGEVADEYDSWPGYFVGERGGPQGGDAAVLCAAFGRGSPQTVERILRAPSKSVDYRFETARHGDLAEVLGLPEHSVGIGYGCIWQGDAIELEPQLVHLGGDEDHEAHGGEHPGDAMEMLRTHLAGAPGTDEALAQIAALSAQASLPAHGYFPALLAGDAAAVRKLFGGEPALDDPLVGRTDGAGIERLVASARAVFEGGAQYTPAGVVETPERVVAHGMIVTAAGGQTTFLPAACVWERAEGGFRELRAYWSPAAARGRRGERAPVLQPAADLHLPDVISRHLQALAADDIAGVAATYDAQCLVPVPLPWVSAEDSVRRQYGARIGEEGAIVLTPCAATDDGQACALEYVTTRWDGAEVPPQAGMALFQRRGEAICEVRIFADLGPAPGGFDFGGGLGGGRMEEMMRGLMQSAGQMPQSADGLEEMMQGLQEMLGGMGGFPGGLEGFGDLSALGFPGGMEGLGGFPGMGGLDDADEDEEEEGGAGDGEGKK